MLLPSDAPERAQEAEDELACLLDVHFAVGLFLGPSGAGDEEELGVGTNRLFVLFRCANASHLGAQRGQLDGNLFNLRVAGFARVRRMRARIQKQEPRPRGARDNSFDALAIEPARGFDGICAGEGGNVRVNDSAQSMRHRGHDARKARALRRKDEGGLRGAAESFASGGIGGEARLRKR